MNNTASKTRLIVTTDISNAEPDDKESMVRLMLYSNEFDIEGLIATSSHWRARHGDPIAPEMITEIITAFGKVRNSLLQHSPGYPTEAHLHAQVKYGNGNAMTAVGDGQNTEGSDHIVGALLRDDPRPVWITAWGGMATTAQALWDLRKTQTPETTERIVNKLRIYDIAGQDDAGAWIAHTFSGIFYMRAQKLFRGMSFNQAGRDPEAWGGDQSLVTRQWFRRNIQDGHGPLGAAYPDCKWIHEGDTPSYMHLLPNGLNAPEKPWYGGWGGRFSREMETDVTGVATGIDETPYSKFRMYRDVSDIWSWGGQVYRNPECSLFRWREAFQNDFAARMDWCITAPDTANHNPVAVVNWDLSRDFLHIEAKPGDTVTLDGGQSYDPDGDDLTWAWWVYPEAGTYSKEVEISTPACASAVLRIPKDAAGTEIHVILTLNDSGTPPLFAFRRSIVSVS